MYNHAQDSSTLLQKDSSALVINSNNNSNNNNQNYLYKCEYCNENFIDQNRLRLHCQGDEHQQVLMSDTGRDWRWRPPPRAVDLQNYVLCKHWAEKESCRFGNTCLQAHGKDELNEWNERLEYRQIKLKRAFDEKLLGKSYTHHLLETIKSSKNPKSILQDHIKFVEDTCCSNLSITVLSKSASKIWTFTLSSDLQPCAIVLLYDTHRPYFEIMEIVAEAPQKVTAFQITNKQEWLSDNYTSSAGTTIKYIVTVRFCTDVYGTFRQSITFDYGNRHILCKNLHVDVVPAAKVQKIEDTKQEITLISKELWTEKNCELVRFTTTDRLYTESDVIIKKWDKLYACPSTNELQDISNTFDGKLSPSNYELRLHTLLYMEETTRNNLISMFNVKAELHIVDRYMLATSVPNAISKYANFGELYAYINLNQHISEDTACGRILLTNCSTVLLSVLEPKVYEAVIEDKGKNVMYLRLSAATVEELKLRANMIVTAELQFQINRLIFCQWHHAIDKLPHVSVIFPETHLEPLIPWSPQKQWCENIDSRLNAKQKEALIAITTPVSIQLPPILLIGPFGTGKTFTFAQAVKELLKQEDTKILICTHSNSAADIYIKDYFHEYYKAGHLEARPLRIYYLKRWVYSVNTTVQDYCLIDNMKNSRTFRLPTFEDVEKHRIVVVTLSTSFYLSELGLQEGYFTHILLDEAAQTVECEAIMPFFLASTHTRIVLAGDHMQLNPEIHSTLARQHNLHVSLLERLYDHYPATFPCKILLCENYRAHETITDFTSEMFYEQKLVASGKQARHPQMYPLTFYTVKGEDIQDINSTAFYNNSEAYEIVERVSELKKNWPPVWGDFKDQSIGILTPYSDQVFHIRFELRKRRLGSISVERVLNVQGKQFRVVLLSVVRTAQTCTESNNNDYGFLSDTKLLNTAITRAQSLVIVVGDPIAMCTISRCSKIWERFLTICSENNSLNGITLQALNYQLDGLELKKLYGLNPLAPEFIPRSQKCRNKNRPTPYVSNSSSMPLQLQPYPLPFFPRFQTPPLPPFFYPMLTPPPCYTYPLQFNSNNVQSSSLPPPLRTPPAQSPFECDLIQFLDKVHLPKDITNSKDHSLHDLMNLLPENMSLAHVLNQSPRFHFEWFVFLLNNKGLEAAERFQYLIAVATKPHNGTQCSNSPQSDSDVPVPVHLPYLDEQFDKPVNQINYDKPVYHIPKSRGHDQAHSSSSERLPNSNSGRLYQRQPPCNDHSADINPEEEEQKP